MSATVMNLPDGERSVGREDLARMDVADWPKWRKTSITSAIRVEGRFVVLTSGGPLECKDGYLAVDARGYPYPIATDEFELIYELSDPFKSGDITVNDHVNDALERVVSLIETERGPSPHPDNAAALEDLEAAKHYLNLGLTLFNSAVYRLNGTWKRADAERVVGWAED